MNMKQKQTPGGRQPTGGSKKDFPSGNQLNTRTSHDFGQGKSDSVLELLDYTAFFRSHVKQFKPGSNGEAMGLCPFHDDHNPSLSISLSSPGKWYCHGCGAKGDIFKFYMLLNKVEFPQALEALAELAGMNGKRLSLTKSKTPDRIVAAYGYQDAKGRLVFQVVRLYCPRFHPALT